MAGLLLDNNLKELRKGRGYGITKSRPTVPALTGRDRGEARKISNKVVGFHCFTVHFSIQ